MKRISLTIALALSALALAAADAKPDFAAILRQIDDNADFGKQDYTAVYSIVTEKPGENPSAIQLKVFRRDEHNQFVFLIQKPDRQKGQGYLKIDENVWFYDPESGNYSHSTIKENIQDSEAKNSDFKKYTYSQDFTIENTESGRLGAFETWILTLRAKTNEVSYSKIRLTVRQDKPLPLKEEDYSVSDRLMRTTLFLPTYINAGGRLIPAKIKMIDEINKGTQSALSILDVTVAKLPDTVFMKNFLERAQ